MISIHDRTDLHFLSHFEIRQRLDAEGLKDEQIILIDEDTAANHAVWFVLTTAESAELALLTTEVGPPPIQYPGETPLYKLHIMTQHLPLEHDFEFGGGKLMYDDLPEPYDPHDPQDPPHTMGVDFGTKEGAMSNAWYFLLGITANPGEYEFSDDPTVRHQPQFWPPDPPHVVRLTKEAATVAGLLSEWMAW